MSKIFDIYDISNKDVIDGAKTVTRKEAFSKKYNLIICSNVLEHVSYPSDLLGDILNVMYKDSVLYIEVPLENIFLEGSTEINLKKKHWHEHVNFYSEESLRCLMKNVGLEIISLRKFQATAGGNSSFLFQIACKLKE